jgi:hypothetical protein
VQSQDYPNAKWAVGLRLDAAVEGDVDHEFDTGAIVRTHVLRPTWHFVAPEDLRWLLALTAPRVHQASAYQYRLLEIDREVASRSRRAIERALRGGVSLTREELGARLREAGIEGPAGRLAYLISHAELEGVVCSGPRRGKRHTYALLEERIPPARPRERDEALAELAGRYVAGHGPAQAADLAWWSGLTIGDARKALDLATPAVLREEAGERTFWVAASGNESPGSQQELDRPVVHLIPNYDELLVAFRDRTDAFDPMLPGERRIPQVILGHVVVRDGLVVGSYRRRDGVREGATSLEIDLAVVLHDAERRALRDAVERFSAFVGRPVTATGFD